MNQIRHPHALGAVQFSVHFFWGGGIRCFIVDLLMQHKFCHINLNIGRSWRTKTPNRITPHTPYSVGKGHPQMDELCRGWMIFSLPP